MYITCDMCSPYAVIAMYLQCLEDISCPYNDDFRCAINGGCIRADDVCDVTEHCLDGSDEGLNCKWYPFLHF